MAIPVNFGTSSVHFQNAPTDTQIYNLFDRIYTQPSEQDTVDFNSYIMKIDQFRLRFVLGNYITGKRSWGIQAFEHLEWIHECMAKHISAEASQKLEKAFQQLKTSVVAARTIHDAKVSFAEMDRRIYGIYATVHKVNEKLDKLEEGIQEIEEGTSYLRQHISCKTDSIREGVEQNRELLDRFKQEAQQDQQEINTKLESLRRELNTLDNTLQETNQARARLIEEIKQAKETERAQKIERKRAEAQEAKEWRWRIAIAATQIALCVIGIAAAVGLPILLVFLL